MSDLSDPTVLLAMMLRLCGMGICVQSLEVLSHGRELGAGRLFGRIDHRSHTLFRRLVHLADDFPGCAWLLSVRAMLGAACVFLPYPSAITFGIGAALLLLQLHYNRRFLMLAGNCETMFLIGLVAAGAGTLPGASVRLQEAALVFVAIHVSLAYLVAGGHKLSSPFWRRGVRLRQIAEDGPYVWPRWVARLARGRMAVVSSWLVIGLESLIPFAFLFPPAVFWALLGAGILFHATVAVTMGLHGFWWSFAAAYPALVFVHAWWR